MMSTPEVWRMGIKMVLSNPNPPLFILSCTIFLLPWFRNKNLPAILHEQDRLC
jgi:hypothetical protein